MLMSEGAVMSDPKQKGTQMASYPARDSPLPTLNFADRCSRSWQPGFTSWGNQDITGFS
jgi:hypothetical protein